MRILITGGAGFIGSHLCDRFLADGHEVIVMDNLLTGRADNVAAHLGNPAFAFTGPTADLFSVVGNPASGSIAAGASREVQISFSPVALVSCAASLEIASDDNDLPQIFVSLAGEGVQATGDLVDMLLGVLALPSSPEQYDVNGDGLFDAADITANIDNLN